jgi:hypothetical protein
MSRRFCEIRKSGQTLGALHSTSREGIRCGAPQILFSCFRSDLKGNGTRPPRQFRKTDGEARSSGTILVDVYFYFGLSVRSGQNKASSCSKPRKCGSTAAPHSRGCYSIVRSIPRNCHCSGIPNSNTTPLRNPVTDIHEVGNCLLKPAPELPSARPARPTESTAKTIFSSLVLLAFLRALVLIRKKPKFLGRDDSGPCPSTSHHWHSNLELP